MGESITKTVDLGVIRIRSRGARDVIHLAHNDLRVATVTCTKGRGAVVRFAKAFYTYSNQQWKDVLEVYLIWKRQSHPAFKLGNHSGRTKDGHRHPWSGARKPVPRDFDS